MLQAFVSMFAAYFHGRIIILGYMYQIIAGMIFTIPHVGVGR